MEKFIFFFEYCSDQRLYSHPSNLSKSLQGKNNSAVSEHVLALLTNDTLISMRSEEHFKMCLASF